MFLYKSSSGIYHLYYAGSNEKRQKVSTGCKIKSQALQFLQTFKTEKTGKPKVVTLSQFSQEFLSFAETSYSKCTAGKYRSSVKKFKSIFGDMPLTSITPHHWDKYKSERLKSVRNGKRISLITVNIELRTLRTGTSKIINEDGTLFKSITRTFRLCFCVVQINTEDILMMLRHKKIC